LFEVFDLNFHNHVFYINFDSNKQMLKVVLLQLIYKTVLE